MWATYAANAGFRARNVLAASNDSVYGQSNYVEANQIPKSLATHCM